MKVNICSFVVWNCLREKVNGLRSAIFLKKLVVNPLRGILDISFHFGETE